MRPSRALLRLAASIAIAHAAVDLDGSQVVDPASKDDPSPIADPITYYPDQHDCPLPCGVDFANVHKWTPYHSVDRLARCELPMLVHFSVPLALDDPKTDILLRSCILTPDPDAAGDRTIANATATEIENPKTDIALFQVSLDTAPACSIAGRETSGALSLTSGGGTSIGNGAQIQGLLDGLDEFFSTKDNCDESFVAAYHKKTVVGVYVGPGLGKPTVKSALQAVSERFQLGSGESSMANRTVAQLCGETTKEETVFGISIDKSRDLVWVQKAALSWTQGHSRRDGSVGLGDAPCQALRHCIGSFRRRQQRQFHQRGRHQQQHTRVSLTAPAQGKSGWEPPQAPWLGRLPSPPQARNLQVHPSRGRGWMRVARSKVRHPRIRLHHI